MRGLGGRGGEEEIDSYLNKTCIQFTPLFFLQKYLEFKKKSHSLSKQHSGVKPRMSIRQLYKLWLIIL